MPLQIKNVQFGLPGIFAPHKSVTVNRATYTGNLSQLSGFDVNLTILELMEERDLNLQQWPGSQAVIQFSTIDDSDMFAWIGVIQSVNAKVGQTTGKIGDISLTLVGWPSTVTGEYFSKRYQFYQDKDSTEMAEAIFKSSGGSFQTHLKSPKIKQAYQVQYGESDDYFMQRILNEEGLLFSIHPRYDFDEFPNQIAPLQCDVYEELQEFPKVEKIGPLSISSIPTALFRSPIEQGIYNLSLKMQRPFTEVYMATDKIFNDSRSSVIADTSKSQVNIPGCTAEFFPLSSNIRIEELIDKNYSSVMDGREQAKISMDASAAVQMQFTCDVPYMDVGKYFDLKKDSVAINQNTAIALVETIQKIEFNKETGLWNFTGNFTGLAQDARYQLPQFPSRNLPGLLKGVVIGQDNRPNYGAQDDDTKIYTDRLGRLKVRILWHNAIRSSNEKDNQDSTIWLRMLTPWAGHQSGFLATPKVGQEVIISFVNNDPNKPIIVGCLYGDDESSSGIPPWDPTQDAWVGIGSRTNNPNTPQHIKLGADKESALGIDVASATDIKLTALKSIITKAKDTKIYSEKSDGTTDPDGSIELKAPNITLNGSQSITNNTKQINDSSYIFSRSKTQHQQTYSGAAGSFYGVASTFAGYNGFFYAVSSTMAAAQIGIYGAQETTAWYAQSDFRFQVCNAELRIDRGLFVQKQNEVEVSESEATLEEASVHIERGVVSVNNNDIQLLS